MRILHIPEINVSETPAGETIASPAPSPTAPAPAVIPMNVSEPSVPTASLEQVESLENISKLMLKRLEGLEERLNALEKSPASAVPQPTAPLVVPIVAQKTSPKPAVVTQTSQAPVSVDSDAVKKNLLDKMWKYMNDDETRRAV